ncbi:hypothetical protein [Pseudomonas sp. TSRC2-2]|uniref:hypothetical protein n=1 Tax=unclassified Pseudomonas TaxID=196821 RepID=UPI003CEA0CC9
MRLWFDSFWPSEERFWFSMIQAIAQYSGHCDRLLESLTSVMNGTQLSVCEGGNDVVLNIDASGVQVDININDDWIGQPERKFSLQEWKKIIESWKYLLELPKGSDEIVLVKLP